MLALTVLRRASGSSTVNSAVLVSPSCHYTAALLLRRCKSRTIYTGPGHPRPHSAVQDIRNIGIIAHVDAVSLAIPLDAGRR